MPFQEYSPFFRPEELDALTAAYKFGSERDIYRKENLAQIPAASLPKSLLSAINGHWL